MVFQSLEYLVFLPIVFLLYWGVCYKSKNLQNGVIVLASFVFYGWWDWRFLGLIMITAFSTFGAGILMARNNSDNRIRKIISGCTIILNIGILLYFKYYNFFIQAFVDSFTLMGFNVTASTLKIILPVGISFYTFSALSYCIDVCARKVDATKDILAYLAYVTFFPSILSGPISRAQYQLPQYYEKRIFDYQKVVTGCKMLLLGAVMKLCMADRLDIYVNAVYANIGQHNGTTLFLTSILYTLQIYADFAGYSLMAIGSGKILGIDLQMNFNRPYFSKTVTEFWRRWHMSLTTWFRDYIYFPLGGNRCGKLRWMFNTMVVFIVSGLWHGAAYTFVIWGAFHGVCMIVERLIYGEKIKYLSNNLSIVNVLRILLTFMIVNFAWIFFRANNLTDAITIIGKIFTTPGPLFIDVDTLVYAIAFSVLIFSIDFMNEYYPGKVKLMGNKSIFIRWTTYSILVVMALMFGVLDGGSFIYFQF